jgi:hypothetical protein
MAATSCATVGAFEVRPGERTPATGTKARRMSSSTGGDMQHKSRHRRPTVIAHRRSGGAGTCGFEKSTSTSTSTRGK